MSAENIKAQLFEISQSQDILLNHLIFAALAQASLTHYIGARGLYVPAGMALFKLSKNAIEFLWPGLEGKDPVQVELAKDLLETLGLDLKNSKYIFDLKPGLAEVRMASYVQSVAQTQGRSAEELTIAWLEQGLKALFPQFAV